MTDALRVLVTKWKADIAASEARQCDGDYDRDRANMEIGVRNTLRQCISEARAALSAVPAEDGALPLHSRLHEAAQDLHAYGGQLQQDHLDRIVAILREAAEAALSAAPVGHNMATSDLSESEREAYLCGYWDGRKAAAAPVPADDEQP